VAFTSVTLTHDYGDVPGTVTFQYSDVIVNDGVAAGVGTQDFELTNGLLSATLYATTDATTNPQGVTVCASERIIGQPIRLTSFNLSAAFAPTIDLYEIPNALEGQPVTYYLSTPESGTRYLFQQVLRAQVWTVPHYLGRFPYVQAFDPDGFGLYAQVDFIDTNNLTIAFPTVQAGSAQLF
jgi:hypothetical protein